MHGHADAVLRFRPFTASTPLTLIVCGPGENNQCRFLATVSPDNLRSLFEKKNILSFTFFSLKIARGFFLPKAARSTKLYYAKRGNPRKGFCAVETKRRRDGIYLFFFLPSIVSSFCHAHIRYLRVP